LHWFSIGTGDAGRFQTFLSLDDVELDNLLVTHTAEVLVWIVLHDGCLMHKHVLLRVIAVDEPVTVAHIEPFHRAGDFCCDDFHLLLRR